MLDPNLKSMRSFYMNANIELPLIALNLAPKPLCCKAKVVVVFMLEFQNLRKVTS